VFGVNVFKVREVMRSPAITRAPEMPPGVEGMVSLRGKLVPVMDLAKFTGIHVAVKPEILNVTSTTARRRASSSKRWTRSCASTGPRCACPLTLSLGKLPDW
jgi:hypothetical protein